MSLNEEIRNLRDRSEQDLKRLWDYYNHTLGVWRLLKTVVSEGRSIIVESEDTGTVTDGPALVVLAQEYTTGYLAEAVFQQLVSLFEDFVFGAIGAWLMAYPQSLGSLEPEDRGEKSDRSIPIDLVLDHPDRAAIIQAIIDRELDRIKYRRLAGWFTYLNKRAKLDVPSLDQVGRLAEVKAARDIMTHNSGFINQVYLDKSGSQARYAAGEVLEISEPYLRDSWQLISQVVDELSEAALIKTTPRVAPLE